MKDPAKQSIPPHEFEAVRQWVTSHPWIFDPVAVLDKYREAGVRADPDPFGSEVSEQLARALEQKRPFSVVRIGDGEANMLTYGEYQGTPALDAFVSCAHARRHHARFEWNYTWPCVLKSLMLGSVATADIVGVLGLWRAKPMDADDFMSKLSESPRGVVGHVRGVDYMVRMALNKMIGNQLVTSAHLYFGVIQHIHKLMAVATRAYCLTNQPTVVDTLRTLFGDKFEHIPVGDPGDHRDGRTFLDVMHERIQQCHPESLYLIGAGPWSEVYCMWIKQHGGVAVDIGSGFDLLAGKSSRPVHENVDTDTLIEKGLRHYMKPD